MFYFTVKKKILLQELMFVLQWMFSLSPDLSHDGSFTKTWLQDSSNPCTLKKSYFNFRATCSVISASTLSIAGSVWSMGSKMADKEVTGSRLTSRGDWESIKINSLRRISVSMPLKTLQLQTFLLIAFLAWATLAFYQLKNMLGRCIFFVYQSTWPVSGKVHFRYWLQMLNEA